jgi:hypothetical protein
MARIVGLPTPNTHECRITLQIIFCQFVLHRWSGLGRTCDTLLERETSLWPWPARGLPL